MKKIIGYGLAFIGVVIAALTMFSVLWYFEVAKYHGIVGFIKAYSYEGHFFAPPAFWLILLFYKHFLWMLLTFLSAAGLVTWIGERMIGDEE